MRVFSDRLDEEERQLYGIDVDANDQIIWPEICVNCGREQAGMVPVACEGRGDAYSFEVPVCREHYQARNKNFGWVTTLGLWISYIGIIGFFVSLYYVFSFSARGQNTNFIFLMSAVSLFVAFLGFYLVRLVQSIWPGFREWLNVPAVSARLKRSTPYYRDIAYTFGNVDYEARFEKENAHLFTDELKQNFTNNLVKLHDAIDADPKSEQAHFQLGRAYERAGDFSVANESYARALELKPDFIDAHKHMGACYFALSDAKKAEVSFNSAAELAPEDPDIHLLLAALYEQTGTKSRVEESLREAADNAGDDPNLHARIGEFHLRMGRIEQALSQFEQVLQIDQYHPGSVIGAGYCYLRLDNKIAFGELKAKVSQHDPRLANELNRFVSS